MFTEELIREQIKEPHALEAARRAFDALSRGAVRQPPALALDLPEWSGQLQVTAAWLEGSALFAVRMGTGFSHNETRGLPVGGGIIVLFDATTGQPAGVLSDNGYLTDLRTGGAGALAADLLAPADLDTVGIIGTGRQARMQIRALIGVREWRETLAWSPDGYATRRFCREMHRDTGIPHRPASGPEEVVRAAQLLYTATPSRAPLVQADWVQPGGTLIAVGSDAPDKQELHVDVLQRADKIVPDDWSRSMRVGELHHAVREGLPLQRVHGELGKVLTGHRPGREADEIIVCDLTGLGAQDAAIAEAAWQRLTGGAGAA